MRSFSERRGRADFVTGRRGGVPAAVGALTLASTLLCVQPVASAAVALDVYAAVDGSGASCKKAAPCSLESARELVRASNDNMSGDIAVHLAAGTYVMAETFALDAQDSGTNGFKVIYQADGTEPVVISGGRQITGWEEEGDGSFAASVPDGTTFRQMWVDGKRAVRARTPNVRTYSSVSDWRTNEQQIAVKTADVPAVASVEGMEVVVNRHWAPHVLRVESIEASADGVSLLTPKSPEKGATFSSTIAAEAEQSYFFENAPELLDAEGEFYLDTAADRVTYRPRDGQTMASVFVPNLQSVVSVVGEAGEPARDITFSGLTFSHASFALPDTEGWVGSQAGAATSPESVLPASVDVKNAQGITFDGNTFARSGASGLNIGAGSRDIAVTHNHFRKLSGQGLAVDPLLVGNEADSLITDVTISDNKVRAIGLNYTGSVGIFVGYAQKVIVEHNDVWKLPYTGISVGWGWSAEETSLRENTVRANKVWDVMKIHDDGAGIYTISNAPASVITENYVYDVIRSKWADNYTVAAIYLDQQTAGYTVSENVIDVDASTARINENMTGTNSITDSAADAEAIKAAAGVRD